MGLVDLDHGELGVVGAVEALVAEVAGDFVDAGHAADEEALEVELGGDAQEEIDVQRVHVGGEGTGRGAAGELLEDRRLDFGVVALVEEAAHAGDDA